MRHRNSPSARMMNSTENRHVRDSSAQANFKNGTSEPINANDPLQCIVCQNAHLLSSKKSYFVRSGYSEASVVICLINLADINAHRFDTLTENKREYLLQEYKGDDLPPYATCFAGRKFVERVLDEINADAANKLRSSREKMLVIFDQGTAGVYHW